MSNDVPQNLSGMSCEERYDYFLSAVGEEREIWILVNDDECFLTLSAEDDGYEYLPVWPNEAQAAVYAEDSADLEPQSVTLPVFLNKWIAGLQQDNLDIGVFPGADNSVWLTAPQELERDLREELDRF